MVDDNSCKTSPAPSVKCLNKSVFLFVWTWTSNMFQSNMFSEGLCVLCMLCYFGCHRFWCLEFLLEILMGKHLQQLRRQAGQRAKVGLAALSDGVESEDLWPTVPSITGHTGSKVGSKVGQIELMSIFSHTQIETLHIFVWTDMNYLRERIWVNSVSEGL